MIKLFSTFTKTIGGCSLVATLFCATQVQAQNPTAAPTSQPTPPATPVVAQTPPPQTSAYVYVRPGIRVIDGHTLVPAAFLRNELGVSVQTIEANKHWRLSFFGRNIDVFNNTRNAQLEGVPFTFPTHARILNNNLYLPWVPLSGQFGFRWSMPSKQPSQSGTSLMLLQFSGTYIESIRHSVNNGKVRVVMDLSHPTRVTARTTSSGVLLKMAAARRTGVPTTTSIGDVTVPSVVTQSGNWQATSQVKLNYLVPTSWHTLDNPPRIVIDVQKVFEQSSNENLGQGLTFTKITRGTERGPVRLFVAKIDPRQGWRLRVAPAGYSVLQRHRTSYIASRNKAPLAINGGFFAYDGAAVGAVKVNNEWIRLPWKGRSAIAFKNNGQAKIGNLQVEARAQFSSGLSLPIRDLNGWPDKNSITALTRRFQTFYTLRPGEMAVLVENGVITSTPGGGGFNIPANGFALVANGGALPELRKATKGLRAKLSISAPGWDEYSSALGGGPRLVQDGIAEVSREGFRPDVMQGLGPRTAIGLDSEGRYIIVVADGRKPNYSTGLTLLELAYTMRKLGAVNAVNLDGGGSTAMTLRGKLVNRPSDGSERSVSNALLVMR
jgi:hypothetical protein